MRVIGNAGDDNIHQFDRTALVVAQVLDDRDASFQGFFRTLEFLDLVQNGLQRLSGLLQFVDSLLLVGLLRAQNPVLASHHQKTDPHHRDAGVYRDRSLFDAVEGRKKVYSYHCATLARDLKFETLLLPTARPRGLLARTTLHLSEIVLRGREHHSSRESRNLFFLRVVTAP